MKFIRQKMTRPIHNWTEEDDQLILKLLNEGKTYNQICAAFSPPAPRGSIQNRIEGLANRGLCRPMKRMI